MATNDSTAARFVEITQHVLRIKSLASMLRSITCDLGCSPELCAVEEEHANLENAVTLAAMLDELTQALPEIVGELELAAQGGQS